MAGKCEHSEKDTLFVGRFVYDVLEYTLTNSGFPKTKIPDINCAANVYRRAKFLKIAGASTLRVSLLMREKWRQTFISRRSNFKSKTENVSHLLGNLATSCSLSRTRTKQSTVELLLASCNEVLLFFHHEGINIDVIKVMKSIGTYILLMIEPSQDLSEKIEGLFDEFDNIGLYTKSLLKFIKKYAIPYGSRDDVSNLFLERSKRRFNDLKRICPAGTLSINVVKNELGYLPCDLFSAVVDESALPESLASTSDSTSSDDRKSQTPAKLSDTSKSVLEGSKFDSRRSTASQQVSEKTDKGDQSSQNSPNLGIEDNLQQLNFTTEDHGAVPKRIKSKKKNENLESASSSTLPGDSKAQKPTKLPVASESGAFGESKSLGKCLNGSGNVSEQTAKSEQSSQNSSESKTEGDSRQTSLDDEGVSQTSHGATPKRKTSKKKKGDK